MQVKSDAIFLFVFLLVMSTTVTALYDLIIPVYIPHKGVLLSPIIAIGTVTFICLFSRNSNIAFNKRLFQLIFILIFPVTVAFLIEPIRFLHTPARNPLFIWVSFLNIFCFIVFYLFAIFRFDGFYSKSLHFYWKINYFIAVSAVFVFFLLHAGILNIENWGLPSFFGDNFKAKYEVIGALDNVYSVPFNYVVIIPNYIKPLGLISEFGSFSGLSYEPHVATYFMTPAFLLTFIYREWTFKNVIIYFLPFFLFFLLASSLTNIIGLLIIFVIYFLSYFSVKKFVYAFVLIVGSLVYIVINFDLFVELSNLLELFLNSKLSGRSGSESTSFILYILSPKSLVGYGIFNIPTAFSDGIDDIGLYSSILLVWFYIGIFILSLYNYLKDNLIYTLIGIYILVHSMKFPMHAIQLPYLYFILFILLYPLMSGCIKSKKIFVTPIPSDNR